MTTPNPIPAFNPNETYTLTSGALAVDAQSIIRGSDGALIPAAANNSDYRQYLAWLAAGGAPAQAPGPSKAALIGYATAAANAALATSITVNVAASGEAAVNVQCDGAPSTRADLAGMFAWGAANPTATRPWLDDSGALFTLTGAELVTLAMAVGTWVDDVFAALGNLIAQINAGAITTTAQIDAETQPTS